MTQRQTFVQDASQLQPGDFIYIERYPDDRGSDGKPLSSYSGGEHIVVNVGAFSVQCVKGCGGVYELQSKTNVNLVGHDRWAVTRLKRDDELLEKMLRSVLADCEAVSAGTKKAQWVSSVYEAARGTIGTLMPHLIETKKPDGLPAELRSGRFLLVNGVATKVPSGATVSYPI